MIYFLSDAHLGSPTIADDRAHQNKLIALLEQMSKDAKAIYMLGDMFDFWVEYFVHDPSKRRFIPFFKVLRKLRKQGIKIHYFVGDHDRWASKGLEKLTGVEIHTYPCSITRYGKTIFLSYGTGLYPYDWYRSSTKAKQKKIRKAIRRNDRLNNSSMQFLYRLLPPAWGNAIGYKWAQKQTNIEDKDDLIDYAKDEENHGNHRDYYVFGHTHLAMNLPLTDRSRVIFLGDCFQQWTYAQLDEQGNLEIKNGSIPTVSRRSADGEPTVKAKMPTR